MNIYGPWVKSQNTSVKCSQKKHDYHRFTSFDFGSMPKWMRALSRRIIALGYLPVSLLPHPAVLHHHLRVVADLYIDVAGLSHTAVALIADGCCAGGCPS